MATSSSGGLVTNATHRGIGVLHAIDRESPQSHESTPLRDGTRAGYEVVGEGNVIGRKQAVEVAGSVKVSSGRILQAGNLLVGAMQIDDNSHESIMS
jgi:hypothetical protein